MGDPGRRGDHKDGTTYRERVELVAVDRGVGEESTVADPVIHPSGGQPLWEGYHNFSQGEHPATVSHGVTVSLDPSLGSPPPPNGKRTSSPITVRSAPQSLCLSQIVLAIASGRLSPVRRIRSWRVSAGKLSHQRI